MNCTWPSFFLLFFLFTHQTQAQISKGMRSYEIEASGGAIYTDQQSIYAGFVLPQPAWLLTEHIYLGLGAGLGLVASQFQTQVHGLFAPDMRVYLNPRSANNHFYLGLEGSLLYVFSVENGQARVFPHIGMNRFIQSDISVRAQLGIEMDSYTEDEAISFALSMQPFLAKANWKSRKSQSYPLQKGSLLLGDPSAAIDFLIEGGNHFQIDGGLAYLFTDKLAAGLNLTFADQAGPTRMLRVTPYARYYLSQKQSSWFVQAETAGNWQRIGATKQTNWSAFAAVGLNQFLSPRIAIESKLGLEISFGANTTAISGQIGMQYILP